MSSNALSRVVSHVLRHEPWLYELELDADGWTPVKGLLAALGAADRAWEGVTEADLERMISQSDKKRHELKDGRVRALYGHSVPRKLAMVRADPPLWLYHGTAPETADRIRREGLRPMTRQFVHLSADIETAGKVGARKSKAPVTLRVDAKAASTEGVPFYIGNETVWLADHIPPRFIDVAV